VGGNNVWSPTIQRRSGRDKEKSEATKRKEKEMTGPGLAVALGSKAKALMVGMRERVKRDPDGADFASAFTLVLQEHDVTERQAMESEPQCIEKAMKRGDTMFTLVGQDVTAPAVLCEWIKLNIESAPPDKLRNALEQALKMRKTKNRKCPD